MEMKVTEKLRLKVRQDVQTTPIEFRTISLDVADEENFSSTQVDGEDETEEPTLERIEKSRKKATERVALEEPSSIKPSIKNFTKINWNTTSYSKYEIRSNARIRVEQDANLVALRIQC